MRNTTTETGRTPAAFGDGPRNGGPDGVIIRRKTDTLPAPFLLFFFLSLFLILVQIHLFAAELSDTRVFSSALVIAFIAAWCMARLDIRVIPFLLTAALSPFAARLLIMLPRVFIDASLAGNTEMVRGAMIRLDSLLLHFDRNLFVFLFPFYGTMAAVYFTVRFPRFLSAAIAASDALFIVIFSIGRSGAIALYAKPLTLIIMIAVIVFLQTLSLILSPKKQYAVLTGEKVKAALVALFLITLGGILALKPAEEGAIGKGGGLLEPKLFSFDFAPFLHLENEISMNDGLVFIMRKAAPAGNDGRYLQRRFVLSGFDRKNGWTRNPVMDEETHPNKLPGRSMTYQKDKRKSGIEITSDYFLVNIDPGAFIALAEPVRVTPYYSNDNASYKTAYSVVSDASDALPFELISADTDDFSAIDKDYYTAWEGDVRVKALAETLTAGLSNYWEKAQSVYLYLKYGDYRYSLKPGAAVDGDQLGQFLFGNKKGYCSYFAFAYAALLRSLGIPARIAVGFFINPNEERLGFYPVRANMAHAWVEVFFPEYGWIEFDPTTDQLAEGETFSFAEGLPPEFESLVKEILETERVPKEGSADEDEEDAPPLAVRWTQDAARFIAKNRFALLGAALFLALAHYAAGWYIRSLLTKNRRRKAVCRYRFAARLLSFKGYRKNAGETEAGFARSLEDAAHNAAHNAARNAARNAAQSASSGTVCAGLYPLYQMAERARFAQEWTDDDEKAFLTAFRAFLENYKTLKRLRHRSLLRFFLRSLLLFATLGLTAVSGNPQNGQENGQEDAPAFLTEAETLLAEAEEAESHENWERAVERYNRGKAIFPDDFRFPYYLGTLYYSQGLYRLAFDEYRAAETKAAPGDYRILYSLAETAGPLNLYAESARYYETILRFVPDDTDAVANLGWLYFKMHRLNDGAALLEDAIDRFGDNLPFLTTLAIIYSDQYRYEKSSGLYEQTIAVTELTGKASSASLAHYNYSILESRFYHHERALAETEESLLWENRYSGYLARGEMYLRRYDFAQAARDYETALETDPTTLSKISLAQVRQTQGRLDEALLLAREALDTQNLSWMLNFGINEDQYKRDIYEILANTSRGLYYRSKNTVYTGIKEKAANLAATVRYYFNWKTNQHLYEKYTLRFAEGFNALQEGVLPMLPENMEVLAQYVTCFDKYPRRALSYLTASRKIETSLIPESVPSYTRAQGRLKGDPVLLREGLFALDPVWEKAEIAKGYEDLYRRYRKSGGYDKARKAAQSLYLTNRGALLQNGIPLPVALDCDFASAGISPQTAKRAAKRAASALAALLRKSGFTLFKVQKTAPEEVASKEAAFTLSISVDERDATADLYETATGKSIVRETFALDGFSRPNLARLAREISALVFTAE
jgi:Tfp pilus assembly protein PilF